jgi:hypothetical protein
VRTIVPALLLSTALLGMRAEASFDVSLRLDVRSAEETLALYEGRFGSPGQIAALRGSQIALATTSLILQRPLDTRVLEQNLEAAKFNQDLGEDVFRMREARAHAREIGELLEELQRRNFGERVVRTVEQLFPADARVTRSIPVYVVAFGHINVDAYVRRVVWDGDVPRFVGEGEGEITIVVNLSKAISYGRSVDERFVALLSVVAHEVFHAAFAAYKDGSPTWRAYYAAPRSALEQLMDIAHNEGIAYYLSLIQATRGKLPPGWEQNVRASFEQFNRCGEELLDPELTRQRAYDILRESNTSGYWESYGAMAGMVIARQIDQTLGRQALLETVRNGPASFFATYLTVMERDDRAPKLSAPLVKEIRRLSR